MAPPTDPALVETAVDLVRRAGELTLEWFQRPDLTVERKADGSPVTVADRSAERMLREEIAALYPTDAIVGEEEADVAGSSGRTWVIDPIDGTKAFTRGVPLYTNLLAVIDEHGPAVGVVNVPALTETVWAGRGIGCFHDGAPTTVNDRADLDGAFLMTSGLADYWPIEELDRVIRSSALLRTWGDGYGYVLVATGRAEAMIDPQVNPWDVAPMAVIIPEAGGRFTDFSGRTRYDGGSGVASNGVIHDAVLGLLGRTTAPPTGAGHAGSL